MWVANSCKLLGAVKKKNNYWIDKRWYAKITPHSNNSINSKLARCKQFIIREFQKKLRDTNHYPMWKAARDYPHFIIKKISSA